MGTLTVTGGAPTAYRHYSEDRWPKMIVAIQFHNGTQPREGLPRAYRRVALSRCGQGTIGAMISI
jgi:hypothetical protein